MKTSNMIMISRVGLNQSLLADQNAGAYDSGAPRFLSGSGIFGTP
jgi:hypothetical protein